MIKIVAAFIVSIAFLPLLCFGEAGYYIERELTLNSGSDQAEKVPSRIWITKDKGRFEMDQLVMIERLDQGKKILLNPAAKTLTEGRLELASSATKFSYKQTEKKLILGDKQASEVIMRVDTNGKGPLEQRAFYVKDVGVKLEPLYEMLLRFPSQRYLYQPFQELDGFPVLFQGVIPAGQVPFESELKIIEQQEIPNDKFEIPADFKPAEE